MNHSLCDREDAVHQALGSGQWPDGLREHVSGCPACTDLIVVAQFMGGHSDDLAGERPLPDPSYLWWRAQLQARADAADRATRVITVFQKVAIVSGALMAVFGGFRFWPQISGWVGTLTPDRITNPLPANMAPPGLVILASAGVIGAWLLFDAYERWTESRTI
jgi:hypothetical protein